MKRRRQQRLDADDVRARVDARDIARALGVVPVREDPVQQKWVIRCPDPAHADKGPSAYIYRRAWGCDGCNVKGDVFSLFATVRGLDRRRDFGEILRAVAELGGVVADSGRALPGRTPPPAPRDSAPRVTHDPEARKRVVRYIWNVWGWFALGGGSSELTEWCERRGWCRRTAWRAGLRDPHKNALELNNVWRNKADDVEAAGLTKWTPWRRAERGVLVPCYDPDTGASGYRFRLYNPSNGRKCLAMPESGGATVVGLETALPGPAPVERYPWGVNDSIWHVGKGRGGPPPPREGRVVFIVEGEPDWLATQDALAQLGVHHAGVVGLCAISKGWGATWSRYIAHTERVVVMVHRGRGDDCMADTVAKQVADGLAELRDTTPRALLDAGAVVRVPVPDDDDLADHHKRGELAPFIERHL